MQAGAVAGGRGATHECRTSPDRGGITGPRKRSVPPPERAC